MFGCNNDRLFPEKYTVKGHISNTKLEKGDHYYIQTLHKDLFVPLEFYSKNTLRRNIPKSARKYKRNVLMPPGHPIILLKLNEFNMAAIVVKRSIAYQQMKDVINIHQTNVKILNRSVFKTCQSRAWYLIQLAEINTKANLSVII